MSKMDFATFIMDLSHGEVNGKLSQKLEQLVAASNKTGKAGTLTLKLTVKKEGTMAVAHADATVKLPEPGMPGTMFFFDEDEETGDVGLTREDPRQLTLKSLASPPPKLRTINGDDDNDDDE